MALTSTVIEDVVLLTYVIVSTTGAVFVFTVIFPLFFVHPALSVTIILKSYVFPAVNFVLG